MTVFFIKSSCPSFYYSSKFAQPAQIFWSGISPAKPQRRQGYGERTKTLINDFHPQSPNFAPFASLREILRVSVAALPHWVLRGEPRFPFWLRFCRARDLRG